MEFKKGDRVLITGNIDDYTYHLDGKIGIVICSRPDHNDIEVKVPGTSGTWMIWNHNATLAEE